MWTLKVKADLQESLFSDYRNEIKKINVFFFCIHISFLVLQNYQLMNENSLICYHIISLLFKPPCIYTILVLVSEGIEFYRL